MRILVLPCSHMPYFQELVRLLRIEGHYDVDYSSRIPFKGIVNGMKYSALHLHMVDLIFIEGKAGIADAVLHALYFLFIASPLARLRGIKIIWTCHEWRPHHYAGLKYYIHQILSLVLLVVSDHVVVHSKRIFLNVPAYIRSYAHGKMTFVPHGSLERFYKRLRPEPVVGIDAWMDGQFRYAMIGGIRRNKEIAAIISAFKALTTSYKSTLLIMGLSGDDRYYELLLKMRGGDKRITISNQSLSDSQIKYLHTLSSVIVFGPCIYPTSGAMETACSFPLAIVAYANSYIDELEKQLANPLILKYRNATDDLRAQLTKAITWQYARHDCSGNEAVNIHDFPFDANLWQIYKTIYPCD